ncbi:MAG: PHP domain-containing protein [Deltaproteobacteria bacterium]|nr:PHP domain-containing protein [Deltaproteobacteria bacterium]
MLWNRSRMNVRRGPVAIGLVSIIALIFVAACEDAEEFREARAYKIDSRSQLIGGPKALGTLGDYMLENDKIRVIVNGQPTDMTGGMPNKWGGAIIDADIQRVESFFDPAVGGKDALVEILPIMDVKTFGYDNVYDSGPIVRVPQDAVEILRDGGDGNTAEVRVKGVIHELIPLLQLIPVPLSFLPVEAETTYSLAPGDNFVKISTTFRLLNQDGSEPSETFEVPIRPISADDNPIASILTGDVFGDALFYGDSLDVIGPGLFGFSSSFFIEDLFDAGRSTFTDTPVVDWSAGAGDGIGYALVSPNGPLSFPVMESFLTIAFQQLTEDGYAFPKPGSSYTYERFLVVDEGDIGGLLDHVVEIRDWPYGKVEGRVLEEGLGRAASDVNVLVFKHPRFTADGSLVPFVDDFDEMNSYLKSLDSDSVDTLRLVPYSRFKTDVLRVDQVADGSFAGRLPVNEETREENYLLMVSGPGNVRGKLLPLRVRDGATEKVSLTLPATGKVKFSVRSLDPEGPAEPCKVTVIGTNGEAIADPIIGEDFLPAGEVKIVHTLNGEGEVDLPAGTYRLVAGRGPEYTVDEKTVTVTVLETQTAHFTIDRVVDSSGYVSGDLHVHSNYSPDSGVVLEKRVKSIFAEDVDVVASSDHDVITNYRPALEDLGMASRILFMPGDELSHFSYAHFNAYPLKYDQTKISGGAPNWRLPSPSTTLPDGSVMPMYTPQDCFDALRARGDRDMIDQDPMVVVNHGQESFTGYFRAFGFEQNYGVFDTADILTALDPVINQGEFLAEDPSVNFSWDFDGMEVLNSKRFHDFRTITVEEVPENDLGQPGRPETPFINAIVRTGDEQLRIKDGDLRLDHSNRGMIDDYFTLLALGKRVTALGTSDTHSTSSTELGKCRTYVASTTDAPEFVDPDEFITNLKNGRTVATCGPFVETWVNGRTMGSDVYDGDGEIELRIKAQAPQWMSLDRLEIYGNGVLIGEIGRDATDHFLGCRTQGLDIAPVNRAVRFDDKLTCEVERDTFINVIAVGYEGMTPMSNPVDGPTVEITDSLILGVNQLLDSWLGLTNLLAPSTVLARNHEIYPYAFTGAIWVDTDGYDADGDGHAYDGPGFVPGWFDDDEQSSIAKSGDQKTLLSVAAAKGKMYSMTSGLRSPQKAHADALAEQREREENARGCGAIW